MFEIDNSIKMLDAHEREVHALLTCINQPTVSLEGGSSASTFAFISALWTLDHKQIEIYVMLYQPKTDRGIFYTHQSGAVPEEMFWQLENDALSFTESMGFMMDNLYYSDLSEVQKQEVLYNFPPFMGNRKLYQASQPIRSEKTTVEQPSSSVPTPSAPALVELDAEAEVILENASANNSLDLDSISDSLDETLFERPSSEISDASLEAGEFSLNSLNFDAPGEAQEATAFSPQAHEPEEPAAAIAAAPAASTAALAKLLTAF
jgi:hypothetical protein